MRFSLLFLTASCAFAAFQDEYPSIVPWIKKFKHMVYYREFREYLAIVENSNLTIAETYKATNEFLDSIDTKLTRMFEKKMKKAKQLSEQYYEKVEKMLKKLLPYFESYRKIVNNTNQTFTELMDAVAELRFTLDYDELEIADIIRYKFSPGAKISITPPGL
ncbi:hypothetical protein Y032_0132g1707 [Ancylostoma ceylanicum]|uniref:SXP/RAL-2 family protein Ani s 5-like cation-binding domain-containing protein n=1 Tax=Ancylostoma ceylanicum TaxID=53326 RepID=A0A016T6N6_9BILA|nr:hypothetical protein Y032_0132g1707 [Ancylostoma ceylanicum]